MADKRKAMQEHLDTQFDRIFISEKDMESAFAYFSAAEKSYSVEELDAAAGLNDYGNCCGNRRLQSVEVFAGA